MSLATLGPWFGEDGAMPFDGTDFPHRGTPPGRPTSNDTVVTVIIVLVSFCLLVMPISLTVFVDIVRYVRGG